MKKYFFYRNKQKKLIYGICSGLSSSFGVPAIFIRSIFLILLFFGGFGLIIYSLLYFSVADSDHDKKYNKKKILGTSYLLSKFFNMDLSIIRVFSIFTCIMSGIIPFLFLYYITYFVLDLLSED